MTLTSDLWGWLHTCCELDAYQTDWVQEWVARPGREVKTIN